MLKALAKVIEFSEGDLRNSVNMLQSAATLFEKNVKVDHIIQISGVVPDIDIKKTIDILFEN